MSSATIRHCYWPVFEADRTVLHCIVPGHMPTMSAWTSVGTTSAECNVRISPFVVVGEVVQRTVGLANWDWKVLSRYIIEWFAKLLLPYNLRRDSSKLFFSSLFL